MKMKKIICILILTCVIIGAAFAQQKPATPAPAPAPAKPAAPAPAPAAAPAASSDKANAFGADLFQLVKGFIASDDDFKVFIIVAGYERLVSPHFSIGAAFDVYFLTNVPGTGDKNGNYLNIALEGRYYTSSENFDKFFVGTTLGYSLLSIDGKTKAEDGGFSGLSTSLKMGYKYMAKSGFYIEPSLAYVLSKSSNGKDINIPGIINISTPSIPTPNGWNGGLRLGFVF
jgi:hypothetical protein